MNIKGLLIMLGLSSGCHPELISNEVIPDQVTIISQIKDKPDSSLDQEITTPEDDEWWISEEEAWQEDETKVLDSASVPLTLKPTDTYATWKNHFRTTREKLRIQYESAINDTIRDSVLYETERFLLTSLVNGIIPHWYGTPWEFYGHTDSPGEGEIACGYFVSTTLVHAGFNLNRFKLAQQSAYNEIRTLQSTESMHKLLNKEVSDLVELGRTTLKEGLYVIGLDFHVGYLLKWKEEVYFLHSNYLYPSEVTIELAETSAALEASASYYIGAITTDKALLKKWLFNTRIPVIMD